MIRPTTCICGKLTFKIVKGTSHSLHDDLSKCCSGPTPRSFFTMKTRAWGDFSPQFNSRSGVCQGCPLSSVLFNFGNETATGIALSKWENSVIDISSVYECKFRYVGSFSRSSEKIVWICLGCAFIFKM